MLTRFTSTIKPDPNQPRKSYDNEKIKEMARSFKKHGMILPIEIDETGMIICGEMRWRAAQLAKIPRVPIIIKRGLTPTARLERQIVENLGRTDLNIKDITSSISKLVRTDKYKAPTNLTSIASSIGVSKSWLKELIFLEDNAPAQLKKLIASEEIPVSMGVEIMHIHQDYRLLILKRVVDRS